MSMPHSASWSIHILYNYDMVCLWPPRNVCFIVEYPYTDDMAPIAFAVRSAILHDAPSRSKRALPAANAPSIVIGITVLVTCFAVAIGATCWLFWWRRIRGRRTKPSLPELESTTVRHELKCNSIVSEPTSEHTPEFEPDVHELPAAPRLVDTKAALPPDYSESLRCQHPALYNASASQPTLSTTLDSSKSEKRSAIERILGINTRVALERLSIYGGKFGPSYSTASADKIHAARPSLYIAPASIWNSDRSGIPQNQQPEQAYVDPYEVEFGPNPVIFPTPPPGPSNKPDAALLTEATSSIEAHSPNTEVQTLGDHVTFDFDLPLPETEMADPNELNMRHPTPDGNKTLINTIQGDVTSPLSRDLAQAHPDDEMEMQIDSARSPSINREPVFDAVSSYSPNPQAEDPVPEFVLASTPNLAPRKREAGRELSRLEINSAKTEPFDNHDRTNTDRSRQRRRHHQRALMPKTSSQRTANVTASPQSSKSTPDSARTYLSFASTATQVPSPGSTAITTPSIGADSPATPFTPSDNKPICRDCGQVFNTPGQQKYVLSLPAPPQNIFND